MRTKRVPLIFLPGPVMAGYSVTVQSKSNDYEGNDIAISETFQGDGRGMEQVEEVLNSSPKPWHDFLGCQVEVDFGKGPAKRILSVNFGVLFLEEEIL